MRALASGQAIDRKSVTLLRTAPVEGGTTVHKLEQVVGATLRRPVEAGEAVFEEDLA